MSWGNGSTDLSSFRFAFAIAAGAPFCCASGFRSTSIDSITPTRLPPIRTSLLGASRCAFGSSTEIR